MSSFVPILKQTDIFYELTATQLELVAALCEEKMYTTADIIFKENDPGDELYIIAQGEIEIQVEPSLVGEHKPWVYLSDLQSRQHGQCQPLRCQQ